MTTTRPILFAASLALLSSAICALSSARADDKDTFDLKSTVDDKGATLDEGRFERQRFVFTFDTRVGYDSNTLDEPDQVEVAVLDKATGLSHLRDRSNNPPNSVFFNFDAGVAYTAAGPRGSLLIAADAGVNYFLDRPGRNYDINGAVTLNGLYKLTPRATLAVSSYNAYESNPDYGASNLTGFSGQAGSGVSFPGSSDQLDGDFFYTANHVGLTYQVSPRVSLVSSGDFVAFAYADSYYATVEDRVELYADEQFVYMLQPTLSAVAEYRFGYVDYFSVDDDSFSNFVLGGFNYTINPRLGGTVRGGVEFRNYTNGSEFDVSPYFEGNLSYTVNQRSTLSLNMRYGIEEGDLSAAISNSRTLRLGLNFNQVITRRLSAYVSFYYTHDDYHSQGDPLVTGIDGDFTDNTFDVAAGLRYAFNRRISAEAGYTYTDVLSGLQQREYDANRCFAGLHFEF
jgi:uncharacterized protein (PEP-CTERM system associated)